MSSRPQTKATAQDFLDIFDITNNLVILKDGTSSMVLTVGAMNFGLLAEAEQDAVIYTYAALLNSLNYPIQVVVQSKTKDVTNYLAILKQKEVESTSSDKRERIARYRDFVTNLIQERNVLDKNFYVVIPATPLELGLIGASTFVPGKTDFDINKYERPLIVDKARSVLEPRRDHLISQFARIGLYSRQLETQEIIKVFYTSYNPEASEGFGTANSTEYQTALVQAQTFQQNIAQNMPDLADAMAEQAIAQEGLNRVANQQNYQQNNQQPELQAEQQNQPTQEPQAAVQEQSFGKDQTQPLSEPQNLSGSQTQSDPSLDSKSKVAQTPTQQQIQQIQQISTPMQQTPAQPINNASFQESIDDFGAPNTDSTNPTTNQPEKPTQPDPQTTDPTKEIQNIVNGELQKVGEVFDQNKPSEGGVNNTQQPQVIGLPSAQHTNSKPTEEIKAPNNQDQDNQNNNSSTTTPEIAEIK